MRKFSREKRRVWSILQLKNVIVAQVWSGLRLQVSLFCSGESLVAVPSASAVTSGASPEDSFWPSVASSFGAVASDCSLPCSWLSASPSFSANCTWKHTRMHSTSQPAITSCKMWVSPRSGLPFQTQTSFRNSCTAFSTIYVGVSK